MTLPNWTPYVVAAGLSVLLNVTVGITIPASVCLGMVLGMAWRIGGWGR
jgi:hypothetical protein